MKKNCWKFFSTEYIVDRIAHSKLGQLLVMLEMFTMNSSSIHHSISTSCANLLYTYIYAYIYIYIHIYIHFTDSVFDNRQLNMKEDNSIIRQHTHARDERQQSQQNALHKNRQYKTSIHSNLNAKT